MHAVSSFKFKRKEEWALPRSDSAFHPVQIPAMMLDSSHVADQDMLAAPASSERRYRENAAGALINFNPEHEITLINSLFICF